MTVGRHQANIGWTTPFQGRVGDRDESPFPKRGGQGRRGAPPKTAKGRGGGQIMLMCRRSVNLTNHYTFLTFTGIGEREHYTVYNIIMFSIVFVIMIYYHQ